LEQLNKGDSHVFETQTYPDREGRIRIIYGAIGSGTIIQIALSLEEDDEALELFQGIFAITLGVLIIFVPFIGWFMAKRALKGVDEVTTIALSIAKGDFEKRVPPKARGEEIERLATTFNYMLDRINALITGIRNMTDNIAHDLRSPITRIRGAAETTLLSNSTIKEYRNTVAGTIEECDRLLDMVNTMLDISEAEAGVKKFEKEEIDVGNVVQKACELFQPIAENKGVALKTDISPPCYVSGDTQMIQRMAANLLDNSLKYTPSKGTVTVSVNRDNGRVISSFSDTGIGIAEGDLPHIFKRFYRCDQSRSKAGVGLGLSLAQAIAKAHGGDITVISNPGAGSTFNIILPRSPRSTD
jgi:signal transduction histidine kinase